MPMTVSQIVDKQIKQWDHGSAILSSSLKSEKFFPIITISREYGALGTALANKLEKTTGFEVWDKKLLSAISEDLGSDQKLMETLDERRKQAIEDAVSSLIGKVHTNVNYIESLIRIVKTIEEHGRSIIVGRGANYICQKPDNLNIRLVRPLKSRVERIAVKENMTTHDARNFVKKKDKEREDYIKKFFFKNLTNASDFDLVINTDTFSLDEVEAMVLRAYKIKTGQTILSKS
jgi:cytidylate kinase